MCTVTPRSGYLKGRRRRRSFRAPFFRDALGPSLWEFHA